MGRGDMGLVYIRYGPFEGRRVAVKVGTITGVDSSTTTRRIVRKLFFNEVHTPGTLTYKIFSGCSIPVSLISLWNSWNRPKH